MTKKTSWNNVFVHVYKLHLCWCNYFDLCQFSTIFSKVILSISWCHNPMLWCLVYIFLKLLVFSSLGLCHMVHSSYDGLSNKNHDDQDVLQSSAWLLDTCWEEYICYQTVFSTTFGNRIFNLYAFPLILYQKHALTNNLTIPITIVACDSVIHVKNW